MHTAVTVDADATVELSRVGVGGVYWASKVLRCSIMTVDDNWTMQPTDRVFRSILSARQRQVTQREVGIIGM